ncbi:flagellar export protein FliJ [Schinkia azotoformans MEV2011]|uniref:Flagellar FliJ protein n=1 Tax=Schinkia azotoformans MEV2011 TaxID=1348973 RepID=A0A072NQB0_SCHAZ|nr:flagellar export protein FliJ [Schinkia azotoformans]KEF39879.1 flagellar export protein FliJ [Schinkia azotoformans MEV2011]MEC1697177.1 flagellar export protein FliJ [Schinkia azotoformans]MEC1715290.1 flagellar export protein FliJ [Schinkia azotoformans]MEC1724216.1 flagellar export protein FliJ [Schinkia azotoformans]MEC1740959.1 flagellar export protein FliJ [Schinkia azotoformans]
MAFKYKFEKLLSIKENEKDVVIGEYNDAAQKFEKAATKLYELLKQKEDLIDQQGKQLTSGLNIRQIQDLQRFLPFLDKSIAEWQVQVAKARKFMELKQQLLLEKNIEVKKYEIMKEKSLVAYSQLEKAEENKLMDEISIQQYMNRGN